MKRCKNDGDCRSGYVCADMGSVSNAWGAKVADTKPSGTKVCVPPWTEGVQPSGPTDVCGPFDAGLLDVSVPQQDAETDSGKDVIDTDSLTPEDDSAVDAVDDVKEETAVDAADEPDEDATQDVMEDTADVETTP